MDVGLWRVGQLSFHELLSPSESELLIDKLGKEFLEVVGQRLRG